MLDSQEVKETEQEQEVEDEELEEFVAGDEDEDEEVGLEGVEWGRWEERERGSKAQTA